MNTKKCKCCLLELDISMFSKNGKYIRSNCKTCCKKQSKKYTGRYKITQKKYRDQNKENIQRYHKNYNIENKEKVKTRYKQYYLKNKDKIIKKTSEYIKKNKIWYNNYKKEHRNKNKIISNIRRGIWGCIKGKQKKSQSIEYLGCTLEEFKIYLESIFKDGMSFKNYGEWHIDHIKPLCSFNFQDSNFEEELKMAWHYTNLQPLWAIENLSKGKTQG